MDNTENASKFGSNVTLEVSLLSEKWGSWKQISLHPPNSDLAGNPEVILWIPAFNVINGGSHAGNKLALQEFIILFVSAYTFWEAMYIAAGIYHNLKKIIRKKCRKDATSVGVENRFMLNILKNNEAPELLKYAIQKTDYTDQGVIGMDMNASDFFRSGKYDLDFKSPMTPTVCQPYCWLV